MAKNKRNMDTKGGSKKFKKEIIEEILERSDKYTKKELQKQGLEFLLDLLNALKEKKNVNEDEIEGGLADDKSVKDIAKKHGVRVQDIEKALKRGIKVEMEHTDDKEKAEEIAMDHLMERPDYYEKLNKYVEEQTIKRKPEIPQGRHEDGKPSKNQLVSLVMKMSARSKKGKPYTEEELTSKSRKELMDMLHDMRKSSKVREQVIGGGEEEGEFKITDYKTKMVCMEVGQKMIDVFHREINELKNTVINRTGDTESAEQAMAMLREFDNIRTIMEKELRNMLSMSDPRVKAGSTEENPDESVSVSADALKDDDVAEKIAAMSQSGADVMVKESKISLSERFIDNSVKSQIIETTTVGDFVGLVKKKLNENDPEGPVELSEPDWGEVSEFNPKEFRPNVSDIEEIIKGTHYELQQLYIPRRERGNIKYAQKIAMYRVSKDPDFYKEFETKRISEIAQFTKDGLISNFVFKIHPSDPKKNVIGDVPYKVMDVKGLRNFLGGERQEMGAVVSKRIGMDDDEHPNKKLQRYLENAPKMYTFLAYDAQENKMARILQRDVQNLFFKREKHVHGADADFERYPVVIMVPNMAIRTIMRGTNSKAKKLELAKRIYKELKSA